jgi:hypothetical protein
MKEAALMATPTNQPATQSVPVNGTDLTTNAVVVPGVSATAAAPVGVSSTEPATGIKETPAEAVESENLVWEAHYSLWNFLVRAILAMVLTVIWAVLALEVWGQGWSDYEFLAKLLGIVALAFWAYLGFKLLRAWQGHRYRLTTRRLFVSSGFFRRRVDQIEPLRIKDLYLQQSMINHWLDVGTVVVVSSEQTLPRAALLGIDRPHSGMDLIWQHSRIEQNRKATAIEQI